MAGSASEEVIHCQQITFGVGNVALRLRLWTGGGDQHHRLTGSQASTAIENIFTKEDELYKAISHTARKDNTNPATNEVLRYRKALLGGYPCHHSERFIPVFPE